MIVGITGGTGSGKTTLLKSIEACGGLILDCDAIYHELLASDRNMLAAIEARFPGTVENQVLDRKKLGKMVFSDPEELEALNRISHAYVAYEVTERLREFAMSGGKLAALDAIELISSGVSKCCDVVIGVLSDKEKRAERIVKRDSISKEAAIMRIEAQRDDGYFRDNCDYILYNNATEEDFCDSVINLLTEVL